MIRIGLINTKSDLAACSAIWDEVLGERYGPTFRRASACLCSDKGMGFLARRGRPGRSSDPVGFAIFKTTRLGVELSALAVSFPARREGIGTELHYAVLDSTWGEREAGSLTCKVDERLVAAQVFLRTLGWRCMRILPGQSDDKTHDLLLFRYSGSQEQDTDLSRPPEIPETRTTPERLRASALCFGEQPYKMNGYEGGIFPAKNSFF